MKYIQPKGVIMTNEEVRTRIQNALDTPTIRPLDPREEAVSVLLKDVKYILCIETTTGNGVSLHPSLSRQEALVLIARLLTALNVTGSENKYIWNMALELHCGQIPEGGNN